MTVRPLSNSLAKKAEIEINEKPEKAAEDIMAIRDWLNKQSHLESIRPTEQWLIAFLRGSKFSLEKSKEKIEMYYTFKTLTPEFFGNRDPLKPNIQEMLKCGVFLPVKTSEANLPRTCILRLGVFDASKHHLADMLKVSLMITEILMLEDDNFTVCGEVCILDLKDVGVSVLRQWTPALAKKILMFLEKALPIRSKSNHMLNTPPGFEAAYSLIKSFLEEKLKKRINVYNKNFDELYKSISKNVLPAEYGGTDGNVQELIDHCKAKVESYRDWFLQQEEARSNESKRSDGTTNNTTTMFGIEGSFRKLEVD